MTDGGLMLELQKQTLHTGAMPISVFKNRLLSSLRFFFLLKGKHQLQECVRSKRFKG